VTEVKVKEVRRRRMRRRMAWASPVALGAVDDSRPP